MFIPEGKTAIKRIGDFVRHRLSEKRSAVSE
jgi:hypothetical protein